LVPLTAALQANDRTVDTNEAIQMSPAHINTVYAVSTQYTD